jgi:ankyrin repeat protein
LGLLDKLNELVAADASVVSARGGDDQTPLHFACSIEVASFLLDHGADIDVLDIDHESTPAQWMMRDRREVARYLVSRGCRIDLLMASALGDLNLVRLLLDEDPSRIHLRVSLECFPKKNEKAGGCIYRSWTPPQTKTSRSASTAEDHLRITRSPGCPAGIIDWFRLIKNLLGLFPRREHRCRPWRPCPAHGSFIWEWK